MRNLSPALPSHDAARWRLERHGWRVIGQHYVAHPVGLPCRDGYGNYVQTERVWLAPEPLTREAVGTFAAAYADITRSIHDAPSIDAGTAARELLRCVALVAEFPTREAYLEAMAPYARGIDPVTVGNAWAMAQDCAFRADSSGILEVLGDG